MLPTARHRARGPSQYDCGNGSIAVGQGEHGRHAVNDMVRSDEPSAADVERRPAPTGRLHLPSRGEHAIQIGVTRAGLRRDGRGNGDPLRIQGHVPGDFAAAGPAVGPQALRAGEPRIGANHVLTVGSKQNSTAPLSRWRQMMWPPSGYCGSSSPAAASATCGSSCGFSARSGSGEMTVATRITSPARARTAPPRTEVSSGGLRHMAVQLAAARDLPDHHHDSHRLAYFRGSLTRPGRLSRRNCPRLAGFAEQMVGVGPAGDRHARLARILTNILGERGVDQLCLCGGVAADRIASCKRHGDELPAAIIGARQRRRRAPAQ